MIINLDEIYKRLSDSEDWDPIAFENHRGEKLNFEQVATIEIEGKNYAYLYEIDANGEHATDFPAVVVFEEKDGEYCIDFVTDQKLIDDIAYEVYLMRRGNGEDEEDAEEGDEFYDDDEYPEDEALDSDEE